jgi:hypothetical protein
MYYPLSAFILLFANIVHNPEDPSVASDLQLMDLVISVLSPMIGDTGPFNATAALQLFQELQNIARKFVESKNLQQTTKAKRAYESDLPKGNGAGSSVVAPQPANVVSQPEKKLGPSFMVRLIHLSSLTSHLLGCNTANLSISSLTLRNPSKPTSSNMARSPLMNLEILPSYLIRNQ